MVVETPLTVCFTICSVDRSSLLGLHCSSCHSSLQNKMEISFWILCSEVFFESHYRGWVIQHILFTIWSWATFSLVRGLRFTLIIKTCFICDLAALCWHIWWRSLLPCCVKFRCCRLKSCLFGVREKRVQLEEMRSAINWIWKVLGRSLLEIKILISFKKIITS